MADYTHQDVAHDFKVLFSFLLHVVAVAVATIPLALVAKVFEGLGVFTNGQTVVLSLTPLVVCTLVWAIKDSRESSVEVRVQLELNKIREEDELRKEQWFKSKNNN